MGKLEFPLKHHGDEIVIAITTNVSSEVKERMLDFLRGDACLPGQLTLELLSLQDIVVVDTLREWPWLVMFSVLT